MTVADPNSELVEAVMDLLTSVRMREGLDELRVARLRTALDGVREAWRDQPMVPREAAGMLAELVPSLDASSFLYSDLEATRIREVAAELSMAVADVFWPPAS